MTRSASSELFIYDLAVGRENQRQGVGSWLIRELRELAAAVGIRDVFIPADNDDTHALDFYRVQGAVGSPVTHFTFTAP
ncbi:GNAT family N-acetyltransferase [Arthrobacter sp. LAPM80]|uniref:GNAT family N-acetyltransferase n=1 Tax=Arthrobacter sp. LAPM80 TaxID=3141788 RepID=UPI00398ABA3B